MSDERKPIVESDRVLLPLQDGSVSQVDLVDLEAVSIGPWFRGTNGYAMRNMLVDGRRHPVLLHRFLLDPDSKMHVDHINGDKLDNRRSNLRVVTCSTNVLNAGLWKSNRSGVTGVDWDRFRGKWRAQQRLDGQTRFLGRFTSFEEAVEARRRAEDQDARYADSPRRYADAA